LGSYINEETYVEAIDNSTLKQNFRPKKLEVKED
jgi:hypothetical protein